VSNSHAAEGLIGSLDTTPWLYPLVIGLVLIFVSALLFRAADRFTKGGASSDGCINVLLVMVGLVLGATGFICLCLGLFGWF
jgi:hypothetical protein